MGTRIYIGRDPCYMQAFPGPNDRWSSKRRDSDAATDPRICRRVVLADACRSTCWIVGFCTCTNILGANPLASSPSLRKHLPYDPLKDLSTVARVGYAPLVLVVPAGSSVKTVNDLIALARSSPKPLNYGSAGVGGSGHLATELLKHVTHIKAQHVPYPGGAPALVDLVGGRLDFMIINPLEAVPHVKAGKLRAIAVSSKKRIATLPDVPTFIEAGVTNFDATVWWGFLVPSATPRNIVDKLSSEILKALENTTVREKLIAQGAVVEPLDAAGFNQFLRAETAKWAEVIHAAGIPAN